MDAENALLHEKEIDRDRAGAKRSDLMKGAEQVGRAVFFVGMGIVLLAKDEVEKFLKAAYEKGAAFYEGAAAATDGTRRSEKIKVPILPINNYNRLEPDQIVEKLEALSPDQLALVRDFETANKNRKRILQAIDNKSGKND